MLVELLSLKERIFPRQTAIVRSLLTNTRIMVLVTNCNKKHKTSIRIACRIVPGSARPLVDWRRQIQKAKIANECLYTSCMKCRCIGNDKRLWWCRHNLSLWKSELSTMHKLDISARNRKMLRQGKGNKARRWRGRANTVERYRR